FVDDLIGDGAQDETVALHALEAGEVEGAADDDADAAHLGDARPDRHDLLGVDHDDGDDGDPALQDHAGHASATAIQPAVWAARALGVDAEHLTARQHSEPRVERCL